MRRYQNIFLALLKPATFGYVAVAVLIILIAATGISIAVDAQQTTGKKLITVYDRGVEMSFLTTQRTLKEALIENDITLDGRDTVEPGRDEELIASEYRVNIYRARPVLVIDGQKKIKVMTPFQTAKKIASDADVFLYDEDVATIQRSSDLVGEGAGLQLVVERATPLYLDLYGRISEVRTQAKTVKDLLVEKKIELGNNGRTSLSLDTPITAGMNLRVWREGVQTISVDEAIPFEIEQIFDADREIGYKEVRTAGVVGNQSVSYEIEIKDGVEISRQEIARIVTHAPSKEVRIVGVKPGPNSLTKAKGAQYFTDSNGVSHRETYYDLNMRVVMQSCGQGGRYTVRVDGAKIDADGYVIVAANYGNYPKCSVVETSMGPGKVYDTGGFAARHPHGFDLATDWSNPDGI